MSTAAACTSGTLGAPPSVSSASSPSPLLPCHPSASLSPSGLRPGGSCVAGCWWARSGRGKPLGRLGNAASAETGAGCSCAPHAGSGAEKRQTGEEKQLDLSIYLSIYVYFLKMFFKLFSELSNKVLLINFGLKIHLFDFQFNALHLSTFKWHLLFVNIHVGFPEHPPLPHIFA